MICEKPLAMTVAQADEMIAEAHQRDRLLVANLMQRYNPVSDAVGRLVEAKVLGELLHGTFENYASDENLGPGHWFWDRSKSGGIFVEHGVHFFDLFAGWLGPGRVVAAELGLRPGSSPPIEEHVQCTVRYGQSMLVNFYHGFHQTGRMDRQELRLVFERGDVTLYDWVPTRVRVHAIADEAQTRALCELFPGARLDATAIYGPKDRACEGRHKTPRRLPDAGAVLGRGDRQVAPLRRAAPRAAGRPARLGSRSFPPPENHRAERPRFAGRRLRGRPDGPGLIDPYEEPDSCH